MLEAVPSLSRTSVATNPAQVVIALINQRIMLMPLLPLIARTGAGTTNTPVPTTLFKIMVLDVADTISQRVISADREGSPSRDIS